jgi:hypothetical protein
MANQPLPILKMSEYHSDPGDTVVTEAKLNPVINYLYLMAVFCDNNAPACAVTGAGLTWVQEEIDTGSGDPAAALRLFRAMKSSGVVEEELTVTFGGQDQQNVTIQVYELNFVDTGGTNGSAAVIQSVPEATASSAALSTEALAGFGDATNNAVFIIGAHKTVEDTIPEAAYVELDDIPSASWQHFGAYKIGEDLSPSYTWTTSTTGYLSIFCEIKMRGATAMRLVLGQPSTVAEAQPFIPRQVGTAGATGSGTTRGDAVQRVGEKLGLTYDTAGKEQTMLRSMWDQAIEEVLVVTRCAIRIGDVALTPTVAEYRLPTEILAIDDGRGSTPAGIGHYQIVTLDEMIGLQSANPVSDSYRKKVAIEGDLMIVSPTPSTSETLRFFYVAKNTASTGDANDFTNATYGGLPRWCRLAVEYFMLWQAAEYDDKMAPIQVLEYMQLFESQCKQIRYRMRRLRDRRNPESRIGYPGRRSAYAPKNSQYPR